jgi:hypothetical protein
MRLDRQPGQGRPLPERTRSGWLFPLFLATAALSLVRAADQPSVELGLGGLDVDVVPGDVAVAALAAGLAVGLARRPRRLAAALPVALPAAAFGAWLLGTAVANGGDATVSAVKLLELGVLGVAAAVLVDGPRRLVAVLWLVGGASVAATLVGLVGFARDPGTRQESFLGEHDLAALSTMALALALAALFARPSGLGRLPLVAGVAGGLGVILGAALASLVGLYLVLAAIVAVALARRAFSVRALAGALAIAAVVTAGTLSLRNGELGFLQEWFGDEPETPGQYAGSWSQRLIYAYVGGRIFLDRPVAGTGWHGLLPAETHAPYADDARARFPDQPEHYFPPVDGPFVPQQTYDQVLYELGLVGAALFLLLAAAAVRAAVRAARDWPPDAGPRVVPYVPAAWTASLAGALAGVALFGGTPMAALFWLTLGVVAAAAGLRHAAPRPQAAVGARPAPLEAAR